MCARASSSLLGVAAFAATCACCSLPALLLIALGFNGRRVAVCCCRAWSSSPVDMKQYDKKDEVTETTGAYVSALKSLAHAVRIGPCCTCICTPTHLESQAKMYLESYSSAAKMTCCERCGVTREEAERQLLGPSTWGFRNGHTRVPSTAKVRNGTTGT